MIIPLHTTIRKKNLCSIAYFAIFAKAPHLFMYLFLFPYKSHNSNYHNNYSDYNYNSITHGAFSSLSLYSLWILTLFLFYNNTSTNSYYPHYCCYHNFFHCYSLLFICIRFFVNLPYLI